jgi:hypothetical protein
MDLDRFVARQNIDRYRRLGDTATDEAQRRMIFRILAEELEKLKSLGDKPQDMVRS